MTRIIKASEVKPGMEVEWTHAGITRKCIGSVVESAGPQRDVKLRTFEGGAAHIPRYVEVTVLSDPAPVQPEEPTEFGARVVVDGRRFLRAPEYEDESAPWLDANSGAWCDWDDLCALGPVQVVPDQGWTVPDTPEVPDRIDKWDTWEDVPKGVAVTTPGLFCHYRKNQGWVEVSYPKENPDWMKLGIRYMSHRYAPWTRVTNA